MSFWQALVVTLAGALGGALFGSLMAAWIVGWRTQKWIEGRELRNRRDDLRLNLYLEIVDLVLENEELLGRRGSEGEIPPVELQKKWFGVSHRLKLLGSPQVREGYRAYYALVHKEVAHPIQLRPKNPNEVVEARDRLIEAMANDLQVK